ncbi:hypothetical protein [Komagataeibacter sp. FNDCF1]|uniref:hypothetical protein n=1 Tax=Komagataeibacter sp. FNDCF1 TaxID=2878681 RepID=UPI001E51DBB5|nr:hypothetical protein [Komagataeibacter sp. FNDCF1]MCE2563364.1 hypothetical protein [Komagataeibacter sp. FNDCF1]
MVNEKMPENREEKGTNPRRGAVLSRMDNPDHFWPTRCGADYVANLAPAWDWDVAVAACQMRAGYDIGEGGRAIVAGMPVSGQRIGVECGVAVPEGGLTVDDGKGAVGENMERLAYNATIFIACGLAGSLIVRGTWGFPSMLIGGCVLAAIVRPSWSVGR